MSENAAALKLAIESCFADPQNEGNLRRFDELFRPRVMAMLVSLYRKDVAFVEDAYQSALIKYIEIFRRGKIPGIAYDAYFVAVAKNALVDELRRNAKQVPLEEMFTPPSQPSELAQAEARIAFFQALSKLDRRCQFLIESYYINSMTVDQIANVLKIQVQSVPMALSRCRDALKTQLKK
jgi:RNA polymerase sigma factor (sigma-70 family)